MSAMLVLIWLIIYICNIVKVQNVNCTLSGNIKCQSNQSSICPNNTDTILCSPDVTYNCPNSNPLNLTANTMFIQGNFSSLTIYGQFISISDLNITNNFQIIHQNYVLFNGTVSVGNYLTLNVQNQSNPTETTLSFSSSSIAAKKMIYQTQGTILIANSTFTTFGVVCLYHPINLQVYSSQIWIKSLINITSLLQTEVTISFIAIGSIKIMNQSQIQTSILMILSQQNISISQSNLNSTAQACRTNMGAGRGLVVQLINNTYCSSGSTGAGYGLSSNAQFCDQTLQYFMFLTHSFPYMIKGAKLSTGSGGYGYGNNNFRNSLRGAGGGIIYIFSRANLSVSSSFFLAAGGDVSGDDPLSAGSGGTIFMYSNIMKGSYVNISVNGGASFNNKGAGAGGIAKISAGTIIINQNQSIWINVSQGYQPNNSAIDLGANGVYYGVICPIGDVRWYLGCVRCSTVRSNNYNQIGSQLCLQCPSSKQFSWNNSAIRPTSPWQCFANDYISPYYLWIVPGQIDIISIGCYIGLLILFSILGVIVRRYLHKIRLQQDEDIQFDFETLQNDIKESKILTDKLKKSKSIQPYQLIYHVHRITVVGSNTYVCPWVLPTSPPQVVKKYVLLNAYENFAKSFNRIAKWTKFETIFSKLLYLIYPLHWYYYDLVKKRKYRKLCSLLQQSRQFNLINNYDFQDKDLITLKYSKNKDYTSCYIDFFFYEKADLSYYNLSVPFIIYLSGQGNFLRPFYIQQNDPFVKAMVFIINRNTYTVQKQQQQPFVKANSRAMSQALINDQKQQLFSNLVNLNFRKKNQIQFKKFIIKFNAISCTLDLSAPVRHFIFTLSHLIDFVNQWNRKFFNNVKVHINLILMISNLSQDTIISSSIHILSNKNKNEQFLSKLKSIIPKMNLDKQVDMKIGLFIYNPDQDIPKPQIQPEDRINPTLIRGDHMLSVDFGQSEDGDRDSFEISEPLLQELDAIQPNIQKPQKRQKSSFSQKIVKFLYLFRYLMLSHEITKKGRYTIKLMQSYLILTQTVLVFVWSIKVEIPYFFINLIAPFVGIIWIVSDSYGFGKLFLIFNSMNLLNEVATFLIYTIMEDSNSSNMIKIIVCQSINLLLVIGNMVVGARSITFCKKLKNVE